MNRNSSRWPRSNAKGHTNLESQQRRLCHLTYIIARNIDQGLLPITKQTSRCYLFSLNFTLHPKKDPEKVLYKSEIIDNTLNINWKDFDCSMFTEDTNMGEASSIIICIWGTRNMNT